MLVTKILSFDDKYLLITVLNVRNLNRSNKFMTLLEVMETVDHEPQAS